MRGGASDVYGSGAVSGVINLVRREAAAPFGRATAWAGSMGTARFDGSAAITPGRWQIVGGSEWLRTDGYVATAPAQRGAVDTPAASRHGVLDLSAARRVLGTGRAFARVSLFGESRKNGTPLQVNDTRSVQLVAGDDGEWLGGQLSVRAYGAQQQFTQTFSSIAPDRESEQLVRRQRVPSNAAGGSAQWVRSASRHRLVAGVEGRRVHGINHEDAWNPVGAWQTLPDAGGTQAGGALFAADTVDLGSVSLFASVRGDRWRSGSKAARAFSPRVAATWRPFGTLTLIGAAYRAFRAPTLNELYRSFRLGNLVTMANDQLGPERLSGVEAGARLAPSRTLLLSGRVFTMMLDGAVANVTLSTGPAVILRQRQNLGRLSSSGVEIDAEMRTGSRFSVRAGYLFNVAVVSRFPADPGLVGRRVPQQPRHALTGGVAFPSGVLGRIAVDARWTGEQFDDDQNRFTLASCATIGASWARALGRAVEVLAAGESPVLGRCEVGKTPATQLGPPGAVRLGTRVSWR